MATYAFDLYPANDPAGKASLTGTAARLARLTIGDQLVDGWYRHVGYGLGGGMIQIHVDHADASLIEKRAYILFMRTDTGPEQQIGGFFLEEGEFDALSDREQGGRILTFSGPGSLFILDRYVLTHEVYATGQPARGSVTLPDQWTWNTEPPGAMLLRAIEEGQQHPGAFYQAVQAGFTRTRDSNSNLWTDEITYETPIGTNVLELYGDFIRQGLIVQGTADIVIDAYRDIDEFRTDRTSATFTAGKARFAAGVNIASPLPRRLAAKEDRSHVLMRDRRGEYTEINQDVDLNPLPFPSYHSFLKNDTVTADSVIQRQGRTNLTNRKKHSDQATVRHIVGSGTGQYAPGPSGDYWVLDLVTLHTGTEEHDFDETPIEVAAITFTFDAAGNPIVETELGAQYIPPAIARYEERISSTIRNIRGLELCAPIVVEGAAGIVFLGARQFDSDTISLLNWGSLEATYGLEAGDFVLVEAQTDANTIIPTIPVAFTTIGTGGSGSDMGHRGGWREHTGTETAYTFTDANSIIVMLYRDVLMSDPIGAIAGDDDNDDTIRYPALTLEVTDGTSWVAGFGHHQSATNVDTVAVTGMTVRASGRSGGESAGRDTAAGVASWTQKTQVVNSSNFWQSHSYEIKADPASDVSPGDGHADLVGTSIKATRCDHAHHVFRDTAPTVNDDEDDGYPVGTLWVRVNSLVTPTSITSTHLLIANSAGAAEWEVFGGGVDLSGINFLVGTASGLLSAEIAVGTTPGGELGGTWASPTVDATHSGSTHAATQTAAEATAAAALATHAGTPHGGSAELLMQDGVSSPPVPLETEDGTDWLYEG